MVTAAELLDAVVKAPTLDGRVAAIRTIPEHVGTAAQPSLPTAAEVDAILAS